LEVPPSKRPSKRRPQSGSETPTIASTSRDQYPGPLLGYSLAYEATETHTVKVVITSSSVPTITLPAAALDFQYCVFAPSESASFSPEITINGFQEFYPDLAVLLRQIRR
jgi:hypothetical protein